MGEVGYTYMSFVKKLEERGIEIKTKQAENPVEEVVQELPVHIYQTESSITVFAQAPGSKKSDIKIAIENDSVVIITVIRREPVPLIDDKHGSFFVSECEWGEFKRRLVLPLPADLSNTEATVDRGVLTLHIPLIRPSIPQRKLETKLAVANET